MSKEIGILVEGLFSTLNEMSFSYCILRNYEQLPERVEHDIDILFEKKDEVELICIFTGIIETLGWNCTCTRKNNGFYTFVCWNLIKERWFYIKLDIWVDFLWRGLPYFNTGYILANRVTYKGYYVPAPGSEAAITSLKELMGGGKLQVKYYAKIQALTSSNTSEMDFINTLLINKPYDAIQFFDACVSADWSYIDNNGGKLKKFIIKQSMNFNGLTRFISFLVNRIMLKIQSYYKQRGLLVVCVGPDGSGKTTVIKEIQKNLCTVFLEQRVFHTRFMIFPELRTGLGLTQYKSVTVESKNHKTNTNTLSHLRSVLSKIVSFIVVAYYTLEYVVGRHIISVIKRRAGLVLFDRYFYDFFTQPTMRDLIWPFRKQLLFFIPKPDIVLHLLTDSHTAYQRKGELSIEEIETQNKYYSKLLKDLTNYYTIQTDSRDALSVAAIASKHILKNSFIK